MPQISVIVPVYKAEAYLHACVNSILSQTFGDFELILVDDGSPDACGTICDEYAAKDARVQVIHQENKGQAAARNRALSLAKGRFCCFVDADDLVHPQLLETLLAGLQGEQGAVSCCSPLKRESCPADFFDRTPIPAFQTYVLDEDTLSRLFSDPYLCWIVWGKLIPTQIARGRPFPEGRVYEDNAVAVRWLLEAGSLSVTESALYFYRVNPESTTNSGWSPKTRLDYLTALSDQLDAIDSRGMKALYMQRLSEFFYTCVQFWKETYKSDPDRAKSMKRLARPRWRSYLVRDFRRAVRSRKLIAFFYPGLKKIWLRLNSFGKGIRR